MAGLAAGGRSRLERWGRAVLQAGKNRLTVDEIIRLHGVLIEDTRFVRAGLRPDGVFLGRARFLYACVGRTVEDDLPREIDYLRRHDQAIHRIMETVEMPDRLAENLVFIRQNAGRLSQRRRENEFRQLRDDEVDTVERIVADDAPGQLGTPAAND